MNPTYLDFGHSFEPVWGPWMPVPFGKGKHRNAPKRRRGVSPARRKLARQGRRNARR